MSNNRNRRERKKLDVRARIVATALKLFSKHGFDEVTVEHIADVADIGKGTIYNYFQTKEDIVVAFMVEVEREVQAGVVPLLKSRKSLDAVLTEFVLLQLRLKQNYQPFVKVFLAQMFGRTERLFPYIMEIQKLNDPPIEALFRWLQFRRTLRKDIDIPQLVLAFKTMQLGITGLWAMEGPPFAETEKVVKLQMKIFGRGLTPDKKS